jgi:hypothetical protein
MKPTVSESTEGHASIDSMDKFMAVRKLSIPNGGSSYVPVTELELSASHSSDVYHLDPSCPDCRRLRTQLASIAQTALKEVAAIETIGFKIFTDPGIVCLPANGQRPAVTVSIYIWNRPGVSTANDAPSAISQVQRALTGLGVHSR